VSARRWRVSPRCWQVGGKKHADIGLELRGGKEDPVFGTLVPLYVHSVEKNSKFDGLLRSVAHAPRAAMIRCIQMSGSTTASRR